MLTWTEWIQICNKADSDRKKKLYTGYNVFNNACRLKKRKRERAYPVTKIVLK